MNPDYTQAMLMSDIMRVVTENAPAIVSAAILIGVVNFILGWFMASIAVLAKAGKQ